MQSFVFSKAEWTASVVGAKFTAFLAGKLSWGQGD